MYKKKFSNLVTGAINQAIINDSGIQFTSHTEFLTKYDKSKKTVMILTDNKIRIALITTHVPISKIKKYIKKQSIHDTILVITKNLKKYFNIIKQKRFIYRINPYAGKNDYLMKEKTNIIIPTLNTLHCKGHKLLGLLQEDRIFQKKDLKNANIILTMYHDQRFLYSKKNLLNNQLI